MRKQCLKKNIIPPNVNIKNLFSKPLPVVISLGVFLAFRFIHLRSFAKHQVKWVRYVKSSVNIQEIRNKGIFIPQGYFTFEASNVFPLDVLRDNPVDDTVKTFHFGVSRRFLEFSGPFRLAGTIQTRW